MGRRFLALGCLAALTAALGAASAPAAKPRFDSAPNARIVTKRLFDVGVADADHDGNQDIFTTNHKFRSVFLRNLGGRSFRDEINLMGLGPDPQFPGLDLLREPPDAAPGVYIWPTDEPGDAGQLHISSTALPASGQISLYTRRVNVRSAEGADVAVSYDEDARPVVDFDLAAGGGFVLTSNGLADLPIVFDFDGTGPAAVSPGEVKVGADAVSPAELRFQFKLRDRHGLAFADVAGDPDQDVFVTTGGLGGGIASPKFFGMVADQMLVSDPAGYTDEIFVSGMTKGRCRGRSVSYGDADGSGRPVLLASCEGDIPKLFAQAFRGGFVQFEAPRAIGRAYRWAQLGRGGMELLVSTRRGLEVWRFERGGWVRLQRLQGGRQAEQIALGDYDNDETLDVMTTGSTGIHLFSNRNGVLRPVDSRLGLPGHAAAASFVDYDNDGRLDVSLAPQGIYRRDGKRFERTGALNTSRIGYAIVEWMDYDNDGRRDPLIATSKREFSPSSHVIRKRNVTRAGHWLEVELSGGPENREAIGAWATARLPGGKTLTQWVGQNDDARHSQGHYRLYFGLGGRTRVQRLVVHWPGGGRSTKRHLAADRLLRISR
ncbi:MAG: CRTAC1 family protein [Solirubrobacterales bacterium]